MTRSHFESIVRTVEAVARAIESQNEFVGFTVSSDSEHGVIIVEEEQAPTAARATDSTQVPALVGWMMAISLEVEAIIAHNQK